MARLKRIWKLYIVFAFMIVLSMSLAGVVLEDEVAGTLFSHLEADVITLAEVMGEALPATTDPSILAAWCEKYAALTRNRVTLIGMDGKVLADSATESSVGSDHLDRPEIAQALKSGRATQVRFSRTAGAEMFYAAVLLKEKGVIIRLSMPLTQIKTIENKVMAFFVIGLYFSPLVAIVITFFFVKHLAAESATQSARMRPSG